MTAISTTELEEMREWAYRIHRDWKTRSLTSDLLVQHEWHTVWPDLTTSKTGPLVEDVYTEALEDKVSTAASISPFVEVAPTRGTRADRAERNAQQRRRAFISFMRDSKIEQKQTGFYYDWFQHGAPYTLVWKDWANDSPYPFLIRMNPRHAYPLTHNSNDELTSILFAKRRTVAQMLREYGPNNAAMRDYVVWLSDRRPPEFVEEIWYVDDRHWGVALYAEVSDYDWFSYVPPRFENASQSFVQWLVPIHEHKMGFCPAVEGRRVTADGEYRGVLDVMIPNLQVAQNIMARLIDDLDFQIYAPRGLQGAENPEDYGPGNLILASEGEDLKFMSARDPVNFEGMQQAANQIEAARASAAFPRQRSGEFGASIASAKATVAVQGSYNAQQAWAQRDVAIFYRESLGRAAAFDEQWCPGKKQVWGFDDGELYTDTYDPSTFWKGDYRCEVGFHSLGLDSHNAMIQLSSFRQLGALSRRAFMRKAGIVDNPLAEEREIALENVADGLQAFMFEQASTGNLEPLLLFAQEVDDDETTARDAAMSVIKKMSGAAPSSSGAPSNAGAAPDALLQQRSMEQGGIPGVAPGLRAMVPGGAVGRAGAEMAPGGSGP